MFTVWWKDVTCGWVEFWSRILWACWGIQMPMY